LTLFPSTDHPEFPPDKNGLERSLSLAGTHRKVSRGFPAQPEAPTSTPRFAPALAPTPGRARAPSTLSAAPCNPRPLEGLRNYRFLVFWRAHDKYAVARAASGSEDPGIQNILNLDLHVVADSLNPSFCVRIQLIDKVCESRHFFLNGQIAVRLGYRGGYT
jgi:hypothetical protein